MPLEHRIGWLSAEFGGALPSAILAEEARLPAGMLDTILEYRYLARAVAIYRQQPEAEGELVDLIREIHAELVQDEQTVDHG